MICGIVVILLAIWRLALFATRFPERTVTDVYPYFHRVEGKALVDSFHSEPEEDYKAVHTLAEFKKWQSKRIHLALHLCRDISANCALLVAWAVFERNSDWSALPDILREGLRGFQVSAMHSRTAAFAIRFRLRSWLLRMTLLPFLPVPSFRTLSSHSNTLIDFYRSAEILADALSRGYGEEIHLNMLAVLGTIGLEWNAVED